MELRELRGARAHDHKAKSLALYRLSYAKSCQNWVFLQNLSQKLKKMTRTCMSKQKPCQTASQTKQTCSFLAASWLLVLGLCGGWCVIFCRFLRATFFQKTFWDLFFISSLYISLKNLRLQQYFVSLRLPQGSTLGQKGRLQKTLHILQCARCAGSSGAFPFNF